SSLLVAAPFLLMWGGSKFISEWLSRPIPTASEPVPDGDRPMIRQAALRTWRYFLEFSTPSDNWLVPDRVQEDPRLIVHQISPTNLGLLLNSQVAAHDLGFVTLSEFIAAAERTLETATRMPKMNGHFYNWYNTQTLEPLPPKFVSAVDSGNLVCSLWALRQACLERKSRPLFEAAQCEGLLAHMELIDGLFDGGVSDLKVRWLVQRMKHRLKILAKSGCGWWRELPRLRRNIATLERRIREGQPSEELLFGVNELGVRAERLQEAAEDLALWLGPLTAANNLIGKAIDPPGMAGATLENLPNRLLQLAAALGTKPDSDSLDGKAHTTADHLRDALRRSASICREYMARLDRLADISERLALECDFSFLFNPTREALSIGYDTGNQRLCESCYDLMASEARAAAFVAIAKGDIPPAAWIRLRRVQAEWNNRPVLASWTGTMFEYLMPSLWMKSYANTLLDRASRAAIRAQQEFARERSVPWGISE
ncbi:MAG: hypothetical protein ACRD4Y_07745, partial [Candidatus Acidiferrales bacterium]